MIHVANRAHVQVRFLALEFFLCHGITPLLTSSGQAPKARHWLLTTTTRTRCPADAQKPAGNPPVGFLTGAHNRNRTGDLFLTKEVLYRLSYMSLETQTKTTCCMERAAGIEPASSAWKAEVLPLNYARSACRACPATAHSPSVKPIQSIWWRGVDSNHRKRELSDLQSDPFGHSGTPPKRAIIVVTDPPLVNRRGRLKHLDIGAGERNRTPDPLITNQLLYRLSYASSAPKGRRS